MKVIVIMVLVLSLVGCAKEQATTKFAEVTFAVDRTLLSQEYISSETGISFNPPKNWKQVSPQLMISIKENTQTMRDSSNIKIELIDVFMNNERSFTCWLSAINNELSDDSLIKGYIEEFKLINKDIKINQGLFSHNDVNFNQLLFSKDDLVTIKLIAENSMNKTFMIDYILPLKFYEEELRSIESSIGTIKVSNK